MENFAVSQTEITITVCVREGLGAAYATVYRRSSLTRGVRFMVCGRSISYRND